MEMFLCLTAVIEQVEPFSPCENHHQTGKPSYFSNHHVTKTVLDNRHEVAMDLY